MNLCKYLTSKLTTFCKHGDGNVVKVRLRELEVEDIVQTNKNTYGRGREDTSGSFFSHNKFLCRQLS